MDEFNQNIPKRRIFPKIFWSILIIILIIFGFLFAKAYDFSSKVFSSRVSFFRRIEMLIFHSGIRLTGEDQGQINILLLGYGGPGHDGPYLTDSMILASINPDKKQVLLTNIPRDTQWHDANGNLEKINQVFSDGVTQNGYDVQKGGEAAMSAVSQLTGMQVPYFASMDFDGFVKMVDRVGGLDVTIDNTFTDDAYPNDATGGYLPPQTFIKGVEHMDGQRALIFARSRHASGSEGSDFARSKRQQKILEAFKAKVQSLNLLSNASTLNDLTSIVADHLHTNMEPAEILHLADILKTPGTQVISQSVDDTGGIFCDDTSTGIYYLVPCGNVSDQQIKDFFAKGFEFAAVRNEGASIIIENSENTSDTYNKIKDELKAAGVAVYEVAYRGIPLAQSVLYEVHAKPATENLIENELSIASQPKPSELVAGSDLVLIIGGGQ